uniref:Uncharacterized protein n=1 Tax=viral metagenome TaxID=1070528 RepID=A0A6M3K9T5_9ZZZZ
MFVVHYSNMGKPERSPVYETEEEALKGAEFLKFQGAKRVRIVPSWKSEPAVWNWRR